MSLGNLIGLLGLLGVVALLVIYLIRPNFQQKFVSSTYIWRQSLKYRKKRIPVNRLRNILLIICQVLIIVAGTLLLTEPFIPAEQEMQYPEKIVIIDASGNMMASVGGDSAVYNTRFDRAVDAVAYLADDVMTANGSITVILADNTPEILVHGAGVEDLGKVIDSLNSLVDERDFYNNPSGCTYGEADMDAAVDLAQSLLYESPNSEVILYTGTTYIDKGNISVVNVSEDYKEDEWNAAIVNVTEIYDENIYTFGVDVVSYNRNDDYVIKCTFFDVNETLDDYVLTARVRLLDNNVRRITFPVADSDDYEIINESSNSGSILSTVRIYSYKEALFELVNGADRTLLRDSLTIDNTYSLYGGMKPVVNLQYSSSSINSMTGAVLGALQSGVSGRWNLKIREETALAPEASGYDMYVYENLVPDTLPTDGVVILFNPDRAKDLGITIGEERQGDFYLAGDNSNSLLSFVHPEDIYVSKYRRITVQDGDFEPVLYCGGDPVLLVKNQGNVKIAIFAFNVNFSMLSMEFYAFAPLMYNLFNYFVPSTFVDYIYEVNDTVELNSRNSYLTLQSPGDMAVELNPIPSEITLTVPGTYYVKDTDSPDAEFLSFFVKMPPSASNILREVDELKHIEISQQTEQIGHELWIYFAAIMVALLFVEWWLQSRDKT